MMNMESLFKRHCLSRGFAWDEGCPIVSVNPKLLFNISGGVVFEDIISGCAPGNGYPLRAASIQRCLRTDGWEKIGVSGRHHLAFEMLGHFSFFELDEYRAKKLMIETAFDFLTDCVGLSPDCLAATAHPLDASSLRIWSEMGISAAPSEGNITVTPGKNRCGFRTEIIWRPSSDWKVELWNLVFTQFQGDELLVNPLRRIACDSGASLDRIVSAKENLRSDYENSNWSAVILDMIKKAPVKDRIKINHLADLGKASVLLMEEGLKPGNKAADYVLRKIIRDAYVHCFLAGMPFSEYCSICCNRWLADDGLREEVLMTLAEESTRFEGAIDRGMKEYRRMAVKYGELSPEQYEYLSSTHGVPRLMIEARKGELGRRAE